MKDFLAKINKRKLTCWESCCIEASRGLMFVNIGQVLGLGDGVVQTGGGVIYGVSGIICWESCCKEATSGLVFVKIGQVLGLGDVVVHAAGGVVHGVSGINSSTIFFLPL